MLSAISLGQSEGLSAHAGTQEMVRPMAPPSLPISTYTAWHPLNMRGITGHPDTFCAVRDPYSTMSELPVVQSELVNRKEENIEEVVSHTGWMRGSKRSSLGAPGFLKLPDSLKTESEAALTATWSTLEAGSCAVFAFSCRNRSAEYSPTWTQQIEASCCHAEHAI